LNNALAVTQGHWVHRLEASGLASWLYRNPEEGLYHGFWIAMSLLVSTVLFLYLWKLDRPDRTAETHGVAPVF
ncbi:MAG: hypothetical protein ABSE84_22075, partial [Isosphaeraceae bacterium]